jgi:hypothetical protein
MQPEARLSVNVLANDEIRMTNDETADMRQLRYSYFVIHSPFVIRALSFAPPGQECSNGSLILLAVVLWRTFFGRARPPRAET